MAYDKRTSTVSTDGNMEQFKKDLLAHGMHIHEQLQRDPNTLRDLRASRNEERRPSAFTRATAKMFSSHEGIRRIMVVASAIWIVAWLWLAISRQLSLWSTYCYNDWICAGQIRDVQLAVVFALLGPIFAALAIQVADWVYRGFGARRA